MTRLSFPSISYIVYMIDIYFFTTLMVARDEKIQRLILVPMNMKSFKTERVFLKHEQNNTEIQKGENMYKGGRGLQTVSGGGDVLEGVCGSE